MGHPQPPALIDADRMTTSDTNQDCDWARQGSARRGVVWPGSAGQGSAGQGLARQGMTRFRVEPHEASFKESMR